MRKLALAVFVAAVIATTAAAAPNRTFQEFDFRTPSGNILCASDHWNSISKGFIQCWVVSTASAGQNPRAWLLRVRGPVKVIRPGDSPGFPKYVLGYGRTWRRGYLQCVSRFAGLRCVSLYSRHGFLLSRERQTKF
jgi:hypothetical protein